MLSRHINKQQWTTGKASSKCLSALQAMPELESLSCPCMIALHIRTCMRLHLPFNAATFASQAPPSCRLRAARRARQSTQAQQAAKIEQVDYELEAARSLMLSFLA